MKMFFLMICLFLSQVASADEQIIMNNGMTCWRNNVGHVYGCSGGVNTGDSGVNDVRTGKRYEYVNPEQAIDTQTGQVINVPRMNKDSEDRFSCSKLKKSAEKAADIVANMQTDDRSYNSRYRNMERLEMEYNEKCE